MSLKHHIHSWRAPTPPTASPPVPHPRTPALWSSAAADGQKSNHPCYCSCASWTASAGKEGGGAACGLFCLAPGGPHFVSVLMLGPVLVFLALNPTPSCMLTRLASKDALAGVVSHHTHRQESLQAPLLPTSLWPSLAVPPTSTFHPRPAPQAEAGHTPTLTPPAAPVPDQLAPAMQHVAPV